jgi:hypothetical protein|eukprot:COSAG01_NODE_9736_length_2359_cov_2.848230_2_plen_76_part_00
MPPKRRVPKGPAPSGLTSVSSFFAACSQAEALGAAAQQALQVQGGYIHTYNIHTYIQHNLKHACGDDDCFPKTMY